MLKKGLLLFAILLVFGCGGGGGSTDEPSAPDSGNPAPVSAFKAIEVTPEGETGVAQNAIITAKMNDDVDPASLDLSGANFKVIQGNKTFSGTASLNQTRDVAFKASTNYVSGTTVVVALSGLKNKSGVLMEPKVWSFTPGSLTDTKAPTVPANLVATAVSQSQINLTWTASTDNVAVIGYQIFRDGAKIGTSTTISFSDIGLTAAAVYSYTVSAYDEAGNNSAQTSSVLATTLSIPDTQAPTVPTNLVATAVSQSQINLTWTASTDNVAVTGYQVFRDGAKIGTSTTASFSSVGLTASTAYSFTVLAYDASGNNSAQTSSVLATTLSIPDTQAPTVPTNLVATAVSQSQINLTWTASTDNVAVTGYQVFRDGAKIGTSTTASFSSVGLTASTAYSFTVLAYDASGNNSNQSAAVNATTQAVPGVLVGSFTTPNGIFYSKGGATQATYDKNTGIVAVFTASDLWDVSLRWSPIAVEASKTYRVSLPCTSTPQRTVEIQLKQSVTPFTVYGSAIVVCNDAAPVDIVTNDKVPAQGDPAARININFGTGTGIYTIGTVTVDKMN